MISFSKNKIQVTLIHSVVLALYQNDYESYIYDINCGKNLTVGRFASFQDQVQHFLFFKFPVYICEYHIRHAILCRK